MLCKNCHQETGDEVLVDLGMQPLANSLESAGDYHRGAVYPLAPVICQNGHCRLIQLPELPGGVGFGADYPYRSGQSESWKLHLRDLVERAGVRAAEVVVEVGGNDGTLGTILPYGATYWNIDPSTTSSRAIKEFMTQGLGEMFPSSADYVFALNVMAHVPDLDDFLAGIHACLKPTGKLVVEVQDVNQLIEQGAWDCIYLEHYSYFNAQTLADAIERRGFFLSKIEKTPTHGGSIRLTSYKHNSTTVPLRIMKPYPKWPDNDPLLAMAARIRGWMGHKRVVGYGAPAKASTFLNFYGIDSRAIEYICDTTPEKQGRYTPGSHIPIVGPDRLDADTPDVIVVLCWNWLDEVLPKIPLGPEVWVRGERVR